MAVPDDPVLLCAEPDDPVLLCAEVTVVPVLEASAWVGPDTVVLCPAVCSVLMEPVIEDPGVILCEAALLEVCI